MVVVNGAYMIPLTPEAITLMLDQRAASLERESKHLNHDGQMECWHRILETHYIKSVLVGPDRARSLAVSDLQKHD